MYAYLNLKRLNLDPTKSIGKGGEADIFDIGSGLAAKIFKQPDHVDFEGLPAEQDNARRRIAEHQDKLRAFPKNLPPEVVVPQDLLTNQTQTQVLGYTMEFCAGYDVLRRLSDRAFREAGFDNNMVIEDMRTLYGVAQGLHKAGVVIGDFNDMNALVKPKAVKVIDADSFQFGKFLCRVFTKRFVDPLLCDRGLTSPILAKPHNEMSDWYAFLVIYMQSLLYVDPYGGVYRPKDSSKRIPADARSLKGITIFHPEVIYPKPATPYGVLPDDLLSLFHRFFVEGKREVPPAKLLDSIRWTKCSTCGSEHARAVCPVCKSAAPAAIKETVAIRGKVTATRIFQTKGTILFATPQSDKLAWLYHENGAFRREAGREVVRQELDPHMRYRIRGSDTLFGKSTTLATVSASGSFTKIGVDTFGNLPVFDANDRGRYWLHQGLLWRDGPVGPVTIGSVLSNQTLFWVGPAFGFGYYRAGGLSGAFVFDAQGTGINGNIQLPKLPGKLVDSTCVFTSNLCWFFVSTEEAGLSGGKTINRCIVLNQKGLVVATAQAEEGDGSWLSSIRGKAAGSNFIFSPTDEGVVRADIVGSDINEAKRFPDTEPFINASVSLHPGQEGLYAVGRKEIILLKIG